jgi:hypothetical protein
MGMTVTSNNVTKSVTAFAHDAAQVASGLGDHAVEIGRSAADVGMDAASAVASNVASAASHLAHSLSGHSLSGIVPFVPTHRSRVPLIVAVGAAAVVTVAVIRARRSTPVASPVRDTESARADSHKAPSVAMAS